MAKAQAEAEVSVEPVVHANLTAAIAAIFAELPSVSRDRIMKDSSGKEYQYRSIHDIMPHIPPLLSKHQVSITPHALERVIGTFLTNGGKEWKTVDLHVQFTVTHASGVGTLVGSAWGEGSDAMDKATNKAHTGAYKNFLLEFFAINDGEDPDDTPSVERGTVAAPVELLDAGAQAALVERIGGLDPEDRKIVWASIGRKSLTAAPAAWLESLEKLVDKYEANAPDPTDTPAGQG